MTDKDPSKLPILGRLKFLLKDSALYGGATAVKHLATLATFPVILRHLSVVEYGMLDFFQVLGAFMVILLVFGQESAVSRYFFEYEDEATRQRLISQSLALRMVVAAAIIPPAWFLGPGLLPAGFSSEEAVTVYRILLFQIPFLILLNFATSILRITFERFLFVSLSVGYSFFQASLWLIALLVLDLRVEGIMYASLFATAVCGLIGLAVVRKWLVVPSDIILLRQMLPYAIPYGFVGGLEAVAPIIDRSLVQALLDAESLGYYAAGAKVAMLFTILAYAFQVAWNPFALAIHKSGTAGQTYDQVLRLFSLGACLIGLGIGAVAQPIVILLASETFAAASVVVFPLVMSFAIGAIGWITGIGISISQKTHYKLLAFVLGLAAGILAVWVLTPPLGIFGTALGVLLGSIVRTVSLTYFAQRLHPLQWSTASVSVMVAVTCAIGVIGSIFVGGGATSAGFTVNIAGLLTISALAILVLFSRDEMWFVLRLIHQRSRKAFGRD